MTQATERAFAEALGDLADVAPDRIGPVMMRVLQQRGIRILATIVGATPKPLVCTTVTIDDVSAETVAAVVRKLLVHFGAPDQSVDWMARAAGGAAASYVRSVVTEWLRNRAVAAPEGGGGGGGDDSPSSKPMPMRGVWGKK